MCNIEYISGYKTVVGSGYIHNSSLQYIASNINTQNMEEERLDVMLMKEVAVGTGCSAGCLLGHEARYAESSCATSSTLSGYRTVVGEMLSSQVSSVVRCLPAWKSSWGHLPYPTTVQAEVTGFFHAFFP